MEVLIKIFVVIASLFIIAFFVALPTMWLWNWLMPEIFGLIEINFWHGLGLNLLTGFLFKSNSLSKD